MHCFPCILVPTAARSHVEACVAVSSHLVTLFAYVEMKLQAGTESSDQNADKRPKKKKKEKKAA